MFRRITPLVLTAGALAAVASLSSSALADPPCGAVEVHMKPAAPDLQIVVWFEDTAGKVIDTAYVTRLIGTFGLGNRPGAALLKSDFRWPYGRREHTFPIWAHRRGKRYPKVVMGGACGNSPQSLCPWGTPCGGDCEDSTIAYHSLVSSYEPFYCSPSGASRVDAMSCASRGTFSKGAYAPPTESSLYPPRADITRIDPRVDSSDVLDFVKQNDLVAVSAATPPAGSPIAPPITWFPAGLPEGDYVAWVELGQEYDFNQFHNHPNQPDSVSAWDFEGRQSIGQPSVVYRVPFHYGPDGGSAIATEYAGYSTWSGADGAIHPPDGTITTNRPGSGAGRLADVNDGIDVYRMKVVVGHCNGGLPDGGAGPGPSGCAAPQPIEELTLTPTQTSMQLSFRAPMAQPGVTVSHYAVRYLEGKEPLGGAQFDTMVAGPSLPAAEPGTMVTGEIQGLMRQTSYAVAVRAVADCGTGSAVVSRVAQTAMPKFVTLSGCFVATAAFGTEMASQVATLRRVRDARLKTNPLGQLATAVYYAMSPPVARAIAGDEMLRAGARALLAPIIRLLGD
jgi:hypothetical protein